MDMLKTVMVAGALALAAGSASAATCTVDNVTYGLLQDGDEPLSFDCGSGNDQGAGGFGDANGWDLADEADWTAGDTPDSGFDLVISGDMWSITGAEGYSSVAVALKHANSFSFFRLDLERALTGTWSISGPGESTQVYSHISAWTQGEPNEIPLPASALLLIGGLGGLALARRRK